jgi:uncharacterized protein YyaL (SSP411 family)
LRLKEDYDGAEPAASSVSVANLLVLTHLLGDDASRTMIERTLARYGTRAGRAARVIPFMLGGLCEWHAGIGQVVIAGRPSDPDTIALNEELARHYLPFSIVVPFVPGDAQAALSATVPLIASMTERTGRPTAFVCRDFACREPVNTPAALADQLKAQP